jgi:hypothetical protein
MAPWQRSAKMKQVQDEGASVREKAVDRISLFKDLL